MRSRRRRFNRFKWADPDAAIAVPLDALDGRCQLTFIGRKTLQGAHATAAANDRHQVAGLHLFVDEFLQCLPDEDDALKRQTQIVDDNRDGALDVLAMHDSGRGGWRVFISSRRLRLGFRGRGNAQVVTEISDFLFVTVFENLYFIRL